MSELERELKERRMPTRKFPLLVGIAAISLGASTLQAAQKTEQSTAPKNKTQPEFKRGTPFDSGVQPGIRLWGNAEYLAWWSKSAKIPVPLVTTGSLSDPVPGAIGQPNTQVLLGNQSIHAGVMSGFRAGLRSWVDKENNYGIEASGFYLPEKTTKNFTRSSDGTELLGIPFYNAASLPLTRINGGWTRSAVPNSGEAFLPAASGLIPTPSFGSISVKTTSRLWGVELNGLYHVWGQGNFRLAAFLGASYTDLAEKFQLNFYSQLVGSSQSVFGPVTIQDLIRTHNEFWAGQLGLRGEWSRNWFFFNFVAKLAMGSIRQVEHLAGNFADPTPILYRQFANNGTGIGSSSGFFVQPTNAGEHSRHAFGIMPMGTFRIGVNLLRELRLSVGYDILYLNSVIRPADQIDHVINETQAGASTSTAGQPTLTGPARPRVRFHTVSYWAQGINAGIEFRF